jgi:Na+/melibiose symporter-like transporter
MGNVNLRASTHHNERAKIYSIVPVISGLASSLNGIFLPIIASIIGGGQQDISVYRLFMPIYGVFCLVVLSTLLKVKERVLEDAEHVPNIQLLKGAKSIYGNKYLWITNISSWFGFVGDVNEEVLKLLLYFGSRREWLYGIVLNLLKLPTSTPGNLMGMFWVKHFSNRTSMLMLRGTQLLLTLPLFFALRTGSGKGWLVQLVLVSVCLAVRNFVSCSATPVGGVMGCDQWDYHQWKTGERMEASGKLFDFFRVPLSFGVSAAMPFLLRSIGFMGDFSLLYNETLRMEYLNLFLVMSLAGSFMSAAPYVFWDLTKDKMKQIRADLEARAGAAKAAAPAQAEEEEVPA